MTQTVLLGDLVEVIKGISYRSADYSVKGVGKAFINLKCVGRGGGFRLDGIKYYSGKMKPNQTASAGDILIANTDLTQDREVIGSPITMPELDEEACFSLDLSKLQIKDASKIDKDYLFYYLKSPLARNYMIAHSSGSTVMHLSVKSVPSMPTLLPNIEEQRIIGQQLKILDEKIELNRKMNETLEQMGQALFKHYFITNTAAKEWRSGKFSDIADVLTGKGSTKSQLLENGKVPLYGANGIMGTSEDYLYNEPLVITGRVGTLGKVRMTSGPVWLSDNVLIMRPKGKVFGYMYQLARSFDYISMNRGSSQPLVTQTDLKNRTILIPDTKILEQFEQQFNLIYTRQKNNEEEIQTLTTLRDTLLPRLISGKIKV